MPVAMMPGMPGYIQPEQPAPAGDISGGAIQKAVPQPALNQPQASPTGTAINPAHLFQPAQQSPGMYPPYLAGTVFNHGLTFGQTRGPPPGNQQQQWQQQPGQFDFRQLYAMIMQLFQQQNGPAK